MVGMALWDLCLVCFPTNSSWLLCCVVGDSDDCNCPEDDDDDDVEAEEEPDDDEEEAAAAAAAAPMMAEQDVIDEVADSGGGEADPGSFAGQLPAMPKLEADDATSELDWVLMIGLIGPFVWVV